MKIPKLVPFAFICILTSGRLQAQEPAPPPLTPEPKPLAHESEAAVVLVGGNSKSETYTVKQETSYTVAPHKLTAKGHYLMGKSGGIVSTENWDGGLRYDYAFNPTFGVFAGETLSGDRFRDIHLQYDTDVGARYIFWSAGANDLALSELGYRLTNFDYVKAKDETLHFIRAYVEGKKSIADNIFGRLWVEYLPSLSRTRKYYLNFEPSLNVKLSNIFAVKTGFLGKYDSQPTAKIKFDYTYTLALVAKY